MINIEYRLCNWLDLPDGLNVRLLPPVVESCGNQKSSKSPLDTMSFRQNIPNVPGFIYQAQFPFGTHASSILHSPKSALTVLLRTLLVYLRLLLSLLTSDCRILSQTCSLSTANSSIIQLKGCNQAIT